MRIGPAAASMSWAAFRSWASSWVVSSSGDLTAPASRDCRSLPTAGSPAS